MAKNGVHNKLFREGVMFQELKSPLGEGFVLRLADKSATPWQATTVTRQPGHETIVVETIIPEAYYGLGPDGFLPNRYLAEVTDPESLGSVVDRLQKDYLDVTPLAKIALEYLGVPEITK